MPKTQEEKEYKVLQNILNSNKLVQIVYYNSCWSAVISYN